MRIKHDNYTHKFTLGLCSIPISYDRTPKGLYFYKFTHHQNFTGQEFTLPGQVLFFPNCTIFWQSFATWSASSSKHFYRIIKHLYSCGRSAISISWSDFPLVSTTFRFTKTTASMQKVPNIEYRSCGPNCSNSCKNSNPTKKFITWKTPVTG